MAPIANCLDRLQTETNAYLGILLPNIQLTINTLEKLRDGNELHHARPLVVALLESLEKRFSQVFSDENVLLATALHPHYTLAVLKKITPDKVSSVKELLKKALKDRVNTEVNPKLSSTESNIVAPDPGVEGLLLEDEIEETSRKEEEWDEALNKAINRWRRSHTAVALGRNLFPVEYREAWVSTFIKFNTPIPSSAAIERVFSIAGDIMRPKRSSLAAHNFEKLVFVKGNADLMGYEKLT